MDAIQIQYSYLFYFIFKKYLFIWLGRPGLSCVMQDLQYSLWHVGSSSLTRD